LLKVRERERKREGEKRDSGVEEKRKSIREKRGGVVFSDSMRQLRSFLLLFLTLPKGVSWCPILFFKGL